ncbi:MAG: hypothetical protein DRQ55_09745 [Planctomycetota bacterium]|nr:MAG: hypothetical protein DRQ55_09745 [Planctomycetota bacterium]
MIFKVRFGTHPARAAQVDTGCPSDARQADEHAHPTARYLAMAHAIERGLRDGTFADYRDAARWLGVSPARANMLGHLVLLAPDIQEAILLGESRVSEHLLRPVCRVAGWEGQRRAHKTKLEPISHRAENRSRPATSRRPLSKDAP